jgi:hypothetical protein
MYMYDFQDDRSSGQIEVIVCLTPLQHMYMYDFQDDSSSGQIEVIVCLIPLQHMCMYAYVVMVLDKQ